MNLSREFQKFLKVFNLKVIKNVATILWSYFYSKSAQFEINAIIITSSFCLSKYNLIQKKKNHIINIFFNVLVKYSYIRITYIPFVEKSVCQELKNM